MIYIPSIPPFSRSEKIADYEALCKPERWSEERIKSADRIEVALVVGSVPLEADVTGKREGRGGRILWYCIFKGMVKFFRTNCTYSTAHALYSNGSPLPPRLPGLSQVIKSLHANSLLENTPKYTIAALS